MLGEAGATVYCSGRSVSGRLSPINRPETIEETAAMVTARGGVGIWAQVDHTQPEAVRALVERVRREQNGQLDILVNDISGDWHFEQDILSGKRREPFWKQSLERGWRAQQDGVQTHLITSYYAVPLMVERQQGLIVEITDGNQLEYNDCGVFYSLTKTSVVLLAYLMAQELHEHNIAVVSLTPGWLRSESMLEGFGVTEANWQQAVKTEPAFATSETPCYIGRAVVALATDPNVMEKTGRALSSGCLAREYGFTDVDGSQPMTYRGEGIFSRGSFTIRGQAESAGLSSWPRQSDHNQGHCLPDCCAE